MNEHHRVRDELRALPEPSIPTPPADLADTVLGRLGRQRRAMRAGIAALVLVLVAAVPIALTRGHSEGGPPPAGPPTTEAPALPVPGGGPSAIHVYGTGGESFVLDPDTASYKAFPFDVVLSPDLTWAAVLSDGRIGIATREALLADGESAVDWANLPAVDSPRWAPNGVALLVTATDRSAAYVYGLDTDAYNAVPLRGMEIAGPAGWGSDSLRYVVPVAKDGRPSGVRYLNAQGTGMPGTLEGSPGTVMGYSPDLHYGFTLGFQKTSTVFYVKNGVIASTPTQLGGFAGWYDDATVALVEGSALVLVGAQDAREIERLPLPGVPALIQIGPSAGLAGAAAGYGF
ncbi:hypothetical protein [Phytomonospora endophytica]|uniref:Uncharacterized protein n=1 Tax=Phytomonospora endophytica TaxID=714109 RepID=A0A841FP94_9ACTN|nr:hypothetical protein [Phytomonospora endophytica]MBB6039131.1 hypothetical protein [Phytomonospora endophytica]GIG67632.1 hypothetical protein Pen01_39270 [Phytomonospora endophytica]